ncbi:hypothetical protein HX870_10070 [Pseudomonas gingeri]|uniref:hypothetical protein n=1 Tax=Pseudomonas gingeri TaxID=117681 RepID=UPI0015A00170|nr:hypothetical protein [Pseudomonas gingeri]NWD67942.1 hypothetical protein [Pseudomonas gingeri]NWD73173.1 hypothetical protein [Pseudomonas gingeri]
MSAIDSLKKHRIVWVWGQITPSQRSELIAFWGETGAITDPCEAWRRTFEVAGVVLNADDRIVGVSSVYCAYSPGAGALYWFYRTFIREDNRDVGLAPRLFAHTCEQLALAYAGEAQAPVGMMIVVENPKLETAAGIRVIQRAGFQHLGIDESGQSVWHRLFLS